MFSFNHLFRVQYYYIYMYFILNAKRVLYWFDNDKIFLIIFVYSKKTRSKTS